MMILCATERSESHILVRHVSHHKVSPGYPEAFDYLTICIFETVYNDSRSWDVDRNGFEFHIGTVLNLRYV